MNKELKCKIKKTTSDFEYDCGEEKRGFCKASIKSGGGGLNILGIGANIDGSKRDLDCFDTKDLKRKLIKKYQANVKITEE